jgi:hypothetical protein
VSATISGCGTFRYTLGRIVNPMLEGRHVALIGVNPSTADANKDDATIRKELGFAARLGWAEITKVNLFAYRATDVRKLATAADPIGPRNNEYLEWAIANNPLIIACWGPLAKLPKHLRGRWLEVVAIAERLGKPLHCFGTAQDGQPRHPLMLAYSTPLVRWTPPTDGGSNVTRD